MSEPMTYEDAVEIIQKLNELGKRIDALVADNASLRASLESARKRNETLVRLLNLPGRQWSAHRFNFADDEHFGEGICQSCGRYESEGHKPNCELAAALAQVAAALGQPKE